MRHKGTETVETERLVLRQHAQTDAEEMFNNWANDAKVTHFLRWTPHQNAAASRELLAQWEADYQRPNTYLWGIVRKSDGVLMGSIGIFYSNEDDCPTGWMPGFCIGRAFWGSGYTTEALVAVVDYFIEATGITTLWCCHAIENLASGRVMEKAGFVFEHNGIYHKPNGQEIPAKYYRLTRSSLPI